MRRNIYNENIIMIPYIEYYRLNCPKESDNEILNQYSRTLHNMMFEKKKRVTFYNDNVFDIAFNLEEFSFLEEIEKQKKEGNFIELTEVKNAYLYSIVNKHEIKNILEKIIIDRPCITLKKLEDNYGTEVLNYILSHKDFSYEDNYYRVTNSDKNIVLCHDGIVEETEIFTKVNRKLKIEM